MSLKQRIIDLFKNNALTAQRQIEGDPQLLEWILANSKLDNANASIKQHAHSAVFQDTGICQFKQQKRFKTFNQGYLNCGGQCECSKLAMKQTNRERYGTECSLQSPAIKEKAINTNLERYGSENVFSSSEIKDRIKQTNLERYNAVRASSLEETKEKMKNTNRERYGTDCSLQSPAIKEKAINTNLERYGVQHVWQSEEIRVKAEQTTLDRYGVKHVSQSEIHNDKRKQTNSYRYGRDHHTKKMMPTSTIDVLSDPEQLMSLIEKNNFNGLSAQLEISSSTVARYAAKYGIKSSTIKSHKELEICEFLDTNQIAYERNARHVIDSAELDFYIPEHSIAIEFNGLYWHSTKFRDKLYHQRKTKKCMEAGIQLLHIFEDEWQDRPEVIKKKILHLCGKTQGVIGARKLKLEIVSKSRVEEFIEKNHIQGCPPHATIYIGITFGNRLVAAVTLKKVSDEVVDMTRFCTDQLATYPGLMSRTIEFIRKNFNYGTLITFADLRYSYGQVYEKCGFTEVSRLTPDYSYVVGNSRKHKFNFRKSRIKKKFGIAVDNKTESQLAEELGLLRIYDSGKIKYEIKIF